jgi:hypothetical protein
MPEISAILTLIPHAYIVLGEASLAATHNRLPGGRNLVPNDLLAKRPPFQHHKCMTPDQGISPRITTDCRYPPRSSCPDGNNSYNGQLMLYTALGYVHPNSPHTLREHIAMDASEHHLYHAENSPSS